MRPGTNKSTQSTLDYREAGVDIGAGDAVVASIGEAVRRTHGPEVIRGLGHFGGFYRLGASRAGTTLVASIDGVGTKLKLAVLAGRHDTIGHDIVNHCVNDILACGASPLFFLDYFATGRLQPEVATQIITSIAAACEVNDIALLGGETAEMPGVYQGDDYDIAGVVVGMFDEAQIIDGANVRAGDAVIGLPSSGFHTNGYSLVRAALGLNEDSAEVRDRLMAPFQGEATRSLVDELLEPHRTYVQPVSKALDAGGVTGMAHITGGGIPGNLARVVPDGLSARLDPSAWTVPPIIDYVVRQGEIEAAECYRVFNMGIGYIVICRPETRDEVLRSVGEAMLIGEIHSGEDRVFIEGVVGE